MQLPFLFAKDQSANLTLNPTHGDVYDNLTFEDLEGSLCTTYMTIHNLYEYLPNLIIQNFFFL
jgi:hypothetical protein